MVNSAGEPLLKQWRFVCSSARMAYSLSELRCQHPSGFKHGVIQGSTTKGTETYPLTLCRTMLSSVFGYHNFAPAMVCLPTSESSQTGCASGSCSSCAPAAARAPQQPHREKEVVLDDFRVSRFLDLEVPLAVHKLLDRKEIWSNKDAMEALATEKAGLLAQRTWLEETVVEKDDLVSDAREKGKKIHLGELMPIASIKHFESPTLRKHKGRIVFRGDNVKDQDGAIAVFQELSASPSAVHTINANICYGCLPGNKTMAADALQAYLQAKLASKYPTWVHVPKELWPAHWHKRGYKRPMCLLEKSLYGHPESGGHWEKHLTKALIGLGGEPMKDHPSSYWFAESKLLLTVYVDDLLLSGPSASHSKFWEQLQAAKINIGEPEDLDRYLGRDHKYF